MLHPSLAENLRHRPNRRAVMTQQWKNLTFLHFPVEPELVQRTLPPGLAVDTFPDQNGHSKAWIGLVPFEIRDLTFRPRMRIPSVSTFLETNVRTYVHHSGRDPGVWFYSLDAASRLACSAARTWFGLHYWHASMSYSEEKQTHTYAGKRLGRLQPEYIVSAEVGAVLPAPQPGDFEFFLVERYLLYSYFKGRLFQGQVHHRPYPLRRLELKSLKDELVQAAGFKLQPIASALFSPGVDVEIFPLERSK